MSTRRRGSTMILVIAVIALLAVLATVYLATSHVRRASALAADESLNLDLARDAALALVRERLYDDTLGGFDHSLFYVPRPWMPSDPDGKGPKTYQQFTLADASLANPLAFFESRVVLGPDFKLYYCTNTHQADFLTHGPPPGNSLDWAPLTASARPALGNLASRWYDYPERPLLNTWKNFGTSVDAAGNFSSIPDQPLLNRDLLYGPNNNTDLSFLSGARFDPRTGDNDLPYTVQGSPGNGDTTAATLLDAPWHMLPFSSPAGTRYRFALRVIDTSRMANLNTGFVSSLNHVIDADGVSISSVQLDNPEIFDPDTPSYLHGTRRGYINNTEIHSPIEWQTRSSAFHFAGFNPNLASPLIPPELNRPLATFFDNAEELELRARAGQGTGYLGRAELSWPKTLQPANPVHFNRNYYTTYSFDRQVTRPFSPRFILLDWPPIVYEVPPPCYHAFAHYQSYNGQQPISLHDPRNNSGGATFIELLDLLVHNGYSDDEAISFALNTVYQDSGNPNVAVVRDGMNFFYRDQNGRQFLFWTPRVILPWRHCPSGGADPPPMSTSPTSHSLSSMSWPSSCSLQRRARDRPPRSTSPWNCSTPTPPPP